jgi:outer membrane protein TolC
MRAFGAWFVLIFGCSLASRAHAEVYTLGQCLELADKSSLQIEMAKDRVKQAHAQLTEIKVLPWSNFSASATVGLSPQFVGSAVYSPSVDVPFSSNMVPTFKAGFDGVIPVYVPDFGFGPIDGTLGKVTSALAAAQKSFEIASIDVEKWRSLVHNDVRKAYFSLQLAKDAAYVLKSVTSKIDRAVAKLEADDSADETDVLRLKTYAMELKSRSGEIEKNDAIAVASLKNLMGLADTAIVDVPEKSIAKAPTSLLPNDVYLRSAKLHRAEVREAHAGVDARRAQVDLAKAKIYPDFGLAVSFGYASAPGMTNQTNPFVSDNYNYFHLGGGLGFRWNLDLLGGAARIATAEAQLSEMEHTELYALGGVGVEVETAIANAKDADIRETAFSQAETLARKWMALVASSIAVGGREDKDLLDPLRAYFTQRLNHLTAIYDYNVALSQLCLATGDDDAAKF